MEELVDQEWDVQLVLVTLVDPDMVLADSVEALLDPVVHD
jgi:hypothetical protein